MADTAFRFSPRPNRAQEIPWRPWGDAAFQEAAQADKPILLSISAVWCHWCHVMDETTYSDEKVMARIQQDFIPIRVDNDQRPDINLRYNMGGWPTTAVLTPKGEIITGGTFVAPEDMANLLDQVIAYWNEHKDELREQLALPALPTVEPEREEPDTSAIDAVGELARQQFDRAYGGIGLAPKFPHPELWELLLTRFTATGEGWMAGVTVRTLDAMAGSALFDHVAGGFFRYSTTREWTIPHFEKMLEDNAKLARLYLRAYQILGDESYRQVAESVLTWANHALMNPQGLWGGSQDADEAYYQLTPEQRQEAPTPFVDPVVHTNWNAMMISTHLLAASLINPTAYGSIALTAMEALWDRMWNPEVGLYHFDHGEPQLPGLLGDTVELSLALLDAYEYSGDETHLTRVQALLSNVERLRDPDAPGYFDSLPPQGAEGRLQHPQKHLGDNANLGLVFYRLGLILGDDALMDRGEALVGAFSTFAKEQALFAAPWALAADRMMAPPLTATIVEGPGHSGASLRLASYAIFDRNKGLRTLPTDHPDFPASGLPEIPVPALYLCRGTVCATPVTAPEQIIDALQSFNPGAGTPMVPEPDSEE